MLVLRTGPSSRAASSLQLALDRLEELTRHSLRNALHHPLPYPRDRSADLDLSFGDDPRAPAFLDQRQLGLASGPTGRPLSVAAQAVARRLVLIDDLDRADVCALYGRHAQFQSHCVSVG